MVHTRKDQSEREQEWQTNLPEPQLQLARVFEQDRKNFRRLALDLDPLASLPELAALQVGLEESESRYGRALH